jgi:hypothetical protein
MLIQLDDVVYKLSEVVVLKSAILVFFYFSYWSIWVVLLYFHTVSIKIPIILYSLRIEILVVVDFFFQLCSLVLFKKLSQTCKRIS